MAKPFHQISQGSNPSLAEWWQNSHWHHENRIKLLIFYAKHRCIFFFTPEPQTPPISLHFSIVYCLVFAQCWVCYSLCLTPWKNIERERICRIQRKKNLPRNLEASMRGFMEKKARQHCVKGKKNSKLTQVELTSLKL